ncbi:MAG: hypothetical protein LAT54_00220 [Cryomorphaceae bacterium]|nr:hypothetical protein [Cryomorphaceae bacterium]
MRLFSLLSIVLIATTSCWKDDLDPSIINNDISSDWSGPLIRAFFDIKNIDEEVSFINRLPDGKLQFVLSEDSVINQDGEVYFDLPPDQPKTTHNITENMGVIPFEFSLSVYGGASLDNVVLHEGQLSFDFKQSYPVGTVVEFRFLNATLNGQPAVFDFEVTPSSQSGSFDVSGLNIDFTSATGVNGVAYAVEVTNAAGLAGDDTISYDWQFKHLRVETIEGYIGRRVVALPSLKQPIDFGGIERFQGMITLYEPELRITVHNPFGIDLKFTPAVNGIKKGTSPSLIRLPEIMVAPASAPGVTTTTTTVFDKNNSDIVNFLQNIPEQLFLQGTVVVNDDQDSSKYNFANRNSNLIIDVELIIPLDFSAEEIILTQESEQDVLNQLLQLDLNRLELDLRSVNRFPFWTELDLIFIDTNDVRLDSISLTVLQPAEVDENGRVTNEISYSESVVFDQDILDIIPLATAYKLRLKLGTANQGNQRVVIYDDYNFNSLIRVKAGLNSYNITPPDDE